MLAPFEASQIKIDRAKQHLQELTAEISSFFERGAVSVVIEQASEYASVPGEMWAFTYREAEPVPATWSAIIGDVLHNLRTSLDLIASDVHRITGGKAKDTRHVHYPFCKSKSDLPEMICSRRLDGIGQDFYNAIEKTAPYKDGNEGLRAIHKMGNASFFSPELSANCLRGLKCRRSFQSCLTSAYLSTGTSLSSLMPASPVSRLSSASSARQPTRQKPRAA